MKIFSGYWLAFAMLLAPAAVQGGTPDTILQRYQKEAGADPAFKGFSAERGRRLFLQEVQTASGPVSCVTCHTNDPRNSGKTRAHKPIEPLAPSANPKRFTDPKKVEKWFGRNCDDVFSRACTPLEKGDFVTYMLSIQ